MLAKKPGTIDDAFCVAMPFMGIHYWQTLNDVYAATRAAFSIPEGEELKWANLMRKSGPAKHMDDAMVFDFIDTLTTSIDPAKFEAVVVTLFKDRIYQRKGYINNAQDIYNVAIRFALQRLQNHLDERHGAGVNCPTLVIADSRRGADNRLRRFVDGLIRDGDLWVDMRRSIIEGVMFQVSNYSVGIQIADMIAGATFQMEVRDDDKWFRLWEPLLRHSPGGRLSGWGYVVWHG